MKRIIILTFSILCILISCDKEEGDQSPKNLSASDGFYVGCIHIDYEKEQNVTVQIERREKGTSNWETLSGGISSTSFDDNEGYSDEGMPPGMVFEYRIRNDMGDNTEYSEIEEGFAFEYVLINNLEISSVVDYKDDLINTLKWNEGNHNSFLNESEILFNVCRSNDSLGTYQVVATVGEDRSYTDIIPSAERGNNVFYRIDIFYKYQVLNHRGATLWYETEPLSGTIHRASSDGGNPVVSYTTTDLGQIAASTVGGITQLLEKNINGTLFLGLINNAGATGYGTPELYSLNGTSWQKEWNINPPNEFDEINYAIATSSHYVAGVQGSLYVYEWNGSSWSNNLAPDNLGQADGPSDIAIEVDNDDNLYMAITQYPDYELQVLKYNGSTWDTIGGDANGVIAAGNIYDVTLEKIEGVLYLYYRDDNSLHVKHLNGTSWETDLAWTKDNIADIEIAKNGPDLYFISGSAGSNYRGGVYKVTSNTTAEEIVSNTTDDWFQFPLSLTIDTEGNLIVASLKYNELTNSFFPFLNLYDGKEWKTISGNFSDGTDPVSISAIGTEIIYNYGEASSENATGDPTTVKSKKMTK